MLPIASTLLAGCGLASFAQRPQDNLGTWSDVPLPPDAALAAQALAADGACRMDDPGDNVVEPAPQILVQDRRTADSAAFLVRSPKHFGSCTITRSTGSSSSGYGPPLLPMTGQITIDDQGGGSLGNGMAQELGGRIGVPAAKVVVQLKDGRTVTASVANGFWLAWWPAPADAARVVAIDDTNTEVAGIAVTIP
jgi:hypothetical protein